MHLKIDIEQDVLEQFASQLNLKDCNNSLKLDSSVGEGLINLTKFPNGIEFHHFTFKLRQELQLSSSNPVNSDFILLNINLSEQAVKKEVNGESVDIQKYLPSGILYYPPNIDVSSKSPIGTEFEIVLVRFHKDLLSSYFEEDLALILGIKDTIVYEDLDSKSEELIMNVIKSPNKLEKHSNLLSFLAVFYKKLRSREVHDQYENIHPQDLKQLFLAASMLRNPLEQNIPQVNDLAKMAGMGKTKFKNTFKQVFGCPPKQYHQKIKMDYAKEELLKKMKTSTEIAYEIGYADPSKFTRAFKNHFGNTPSQI